ncbi:hypothetical protein Emed_005761 [Eimeria media]
MEIVGALGESQNPPGLACLKKFCTASECCAPLRRIAFKVSAVSLRTLVSNEDNPSEEADLSGSGSETEEPTELESAVGVLPGTLKDNGTASRGSLAEPTDTGHEMRQALAVALKQQRRRRAAAAALAAASARLTAFTTSLLRTRANTPLFTWGIPQSTGTTASSGDLPADAAESAAPFLIFSGTGILRNALWCTSLRSVIDKTIEEPLTPIGADQIAVWPLVSLCKVLQRGGPNTCGREACFVGPFLTQIAVSCSDGLLVAGTSDGRVLLLLADVPDACAVVRVFDSHTGLVLSACLTPLQAPGRWSLAAAAQSGEWWRCELDCHLLRRHLEKAKAVECAKPEAAAANASASISDAQHATRSGPAQQHAEKQQQQQQLLRRLLMADLPAEDDHRSRPDESADAMLSNAKKKKDMKGPCPEPVNVDEFLRVVTMNRPPAEGCVRSNYCDQTEDVLDPSEPTLVDLVAEVRCLAGAITEELQAKLMLRTSLSQANEAEAANLMEELDCQLQDARRHHQAIISKIADSSALKAVAEDTVDPKAQADLLAVVHAARVQELKDLLMQEPPEVQSVSGLQPQVASLNLRQERLGQLKNSGSLFETDADKAETAMVEAALAEARRLPENFGVSFEHLLRRPLSDSNNKGSEIATDTRGPQRTLVSKMLDASYPQEADASNACLRVDDKLSGHIELLKQMEAQQSHMESRVLALNEVARFHPQIHEDERSRDVTLPRPTAWVEHQIMHVKFHGRKILRAIEDSLNIFDGELRNLLRKRAVIQEQLALAKLKRLQTCVHCDPPTRTPVLGDEVAAYAEHHEELLVIGATEPRSLKVQQDLLNERAECQRINDSIARLEANTRAKSASIENCHAHEADIRRRLHEAIGPRHPQYGALLQIFERKVRPKPGNLSFASPDGGDEENPDDGSGKEDLQQQGSEDIVVDVCPLGCDMALYEALLELRDQKMANDSELARHHRELDELRKVCEHLSTHQQRGQVKHWEPARGLHERTSVRSSAVVLSCHCHASARSACAAGECKTSVDASAAFISVQIYCLSYEPEAWRLPMSLNSAVLFSRKGFAALRQQVTEIFQEVAVVAEDLRQLKRSLTAAKKDDSQSNQRLTDLRSTFKEVQLVRFGMSLTLEEVEAAAKLAGKADKRARAEPLTPAFERDVEAIAYKQAQLNGQQEQHDRLKQRLKNITKLHASVSRRFASSRERDLLLSQQLRSKTSHQAATPWLQSSAEDTHPARKQRDEFAHLKQEFEKRQDEIKSLQKLIRHMQIKGEHIEPSGLWH